jgi:hypothetical protein
MARSRVCACRGCDCHRGTCGWPTTNERRCDCCGRPGFANRFRRTPDHPVRRTSAWRRLAKRTVEDWVTAHGWTCPGLAPPATRCQTARARGRPSGAARPRWRALAGAARGPLRELQRAEGVESAAAVRPGFHKLRISASVDLGTPIRERPLPLGVGPRYRWHVRQVTSHRVRRPRPDPPRLPGTAAS